MISFFKITWFRKITVELPLLLILTSFLLMGSLTTNLIIYRTCYVILGYNESQCALLGRETSPELQLLEKKVQPTANILAFVMELPLNILPVITCIFAGPWSDKYGRKPVQLLTLTGLTMTFALLAILVCFKNLSPWYFLIATIPTMLSGSVPTYFSVVLSYLNDISTDETRGLRMVIFEVVMILGLLIGSLSSAPLLYATNYETVFFLATGLLGIATLYTMLFLPESVKTKDVGESKVSEIIRCTYLVDISKVLFKKRGDNWNRLIVIVLFLAMSLINFTTNGSNVVKFQFLREKLSWSLVKHNYYSCFAHIISILGTIAGTLVLNKVFKIRETVVAVLGLISTIGSCFLWGLATNDYYIYAGAVVAILSGASAPMIRTRMAQIVPPEEMGKIFALIIGVGGLVSLGSTFLFTLIYNATINFNSGSFNFLSAFLYCFGAFLLGVVIIFEMCSPNKQTRSDLGSKVTNEIDSEISKS